MNVEQKEAWLRIPIGILVFIVIDLLAVIIFLLMLFNFFYTLIEKKRNKRVAVFSNLIVTYIYNAYRYVTFNTNHRPFPFNDFQKPFDKFDSKKGQ